jgi:hypothetical protein
MWIADPLLLYITTRTIFTAFTCSKRNTCGIIGTNGKLFIRVQVNVHYRHFILNLSCQNVIKSDALKLLTSFCQVYQIFQILSLHICYQIRLLVLSVVRITLHKILSYNILLPCVSVWLLGDRNLLPLRKKRRPIPIPVSLLGNCLMHQAITVRRHSNKQYSTGKRKHIFIINKEFHDFWAVYIKKSQGKEYASYQQDKGNFSEGNIYS